MMAIVGHSALLYRLGAGRGQYLTTSVHEAVSKNTETDLPDWIYLRLTHCRLTCRHSAPECSGSSLSMTKDGRYLLPYRTYRRDGPNAWPGTVALLKEFGMREADLDDAGYDGDGQFED